MDAVPKAHDGDLQMFDAASVRVHGGAQAIAAQGGVVALYRLHERLAHPVALGQRSGVTQSTRFRVAAKDSVSASV